MCSIMGLIDARNAFTARDRGLIMRSLSILSEVRGTDATGFAYNHNDYLHIIKSPVPARRMKLQLPDSSNVIIGHTRMTTQGSEKRNYNNHPFFGRTTDARFALVHNGIIYNDDVLRETHRLPKTNIQTDTYIAVQLIERKKNLSFSSLKYMAEQVKGVFTFAILDNQNNVWIVKGDNPVCIYYNTDYGFYFFSSTKEIMDELLKNTGLDKLRFDEVHMVEGDILKITSSGSLEWSKFKPCHDFGYGYMGLRDYRSYMGFGRTDCNSRFGSHHWYEDDWELIEADTEEIRLLKHNARKFGFNDDEVDILLFGGYNPDEIELMFNSPREFSEAIDCALEVCYE